jgi:hypothetical protein
VGKVRLEISTGEGMITTANPPVRGMAFSMRPDFTPKTGTIFMTSSLLTAILIVFHSP